MNPQLSQVTQLKQEYPNVIFWFDSEEEYRAFGEDAIKTSEILGIPVGKSGDSMIDLATFSRASLETFLPKMVKSGFKVGIVENKIIESCKTNSIKRSATGCCP